MYINLFDTVIFTFCLNFLYTADETHSYINASYHDCRDVIIIWFSREVSGRVIDDVIKIF